MARSPNTPIIPGTAWIEQVKINEINNRVSQILEGNDDTNISCPSCWENTTSFICNWCGAVIWEDGSLVWRREELLHSDYEIEQLVDESASEKQIPVLEGTFIIDKKRKIPASEKEVLVTLLVVDWMTYKVWIRPFAEKKIAYIKTKHIKKSKTFYKTIFVSEDRFQRIRRMAQHIVLNAKTFEIDTLSAMKR